MKYIVVQPHQPESAEFISCAVSDRLRFEEKETIYPGWIWCIDAAGVGAWAPESYVAKSGQWCTFIRDYLSRELDLNVNDVVEVISFESDWAWVIDQQGRKGWIPTASLERLAWSQT